jgi:hypothetical protein
MLYEGIHIDLRFVRALRPCARRWCAGREHQLPAGEDTNLIAGDCATL